MWKEKDKNFDQEIGEFEWIKEDTIIKDLFSTLEWDKWFGNVFKTLKKYASKKDFQNIININEDNSLEKFVTFFFELFDPDFTRSNRKEIPLYITRIKKELQRIWCQKFDVLRKNEFFNFFCAYSLVCQQDIMQEGMIQSISKNLSVDEIKSISWENLEQVLRDLKNPKIISTIWQVLYKIFLDSWGVDYWLWETKKMLEEKYPNDNIDIYTITKIAQKNFNLFIEYLYWLKLPEMSFEAVLSDDFFNIESEEDLAAISLFYKKAFSKMMNEKPN